MSNLSDYPTHRAQQPTNRGRRTRVPIDAAARTVIARKGFLATTIADIATEAGRSTSSFYNYYDAEEAMIREWALRFRQYRAEICSIPDSFIAEMVQPAQADGYRADDEACGATLSNIFYRASYYKEGS